MKTIKLLIILLPGLLRAAAQPMPALIPYFDNGLWGYCDSNAQVKIKPQWQKTFFFTNNRALVELDSNHDYYYCLIDQLGSYIIPPYRHWNRRYNAGLTGATFNARGKDGKWGIIDTVNKERIPCLYDQKDDLPFRYSAAWNKCYKPAKKNGKYGLIDTLNQVLLPFAYDSVLYHYQVDGEIPYYYHLVKKNGLRGLVDTANRTIIPCRYEYIGLKEGERYRGLIYYDSSYRHGYALPDGTVMFDDPRYSVQEVLTDSLFAVQDKKKKSEGCIGVMTWDKKMIIPCNYHHFSLWHDTLVVTRDTLRATTSGRKIRQYDRRYYSLSAHRYLTGWLTDPEQNPAAASPQQERRIIWVNGRYVSTFEKDGFTWTVQDKSPYNILKGKAPGTDTSDYWAVVDDSCRYIIGPGRTEYQVYRYFAHERLAVVQLPGNDRRKNSFVVMNAQRERLSAVMDQKIQGIFRWQDSLYLVVRQLPSWIDDQAYGYPNTEEGEDLHRYDRIARFRVIHSNGVPVAALAGCDISAFCNQYGYVTGKYSMNNQWDKAFTGYFLAGNQLIVDMNGKIRFPGLFKAGEPLTSLDNGLFAVSENPDDDPADKVLDSTGRVILQGYSIVGIHLYEPAAILCMPWQTTYMDPVKLENTAPIYELVCMDGYDYRFFFMGRNYTPYMSGTKKFKPRPRSYRGWGTPKF